MADKGFTPEKDKKAMRNELARLQRENKRLKLKLEPNQEPTASFFSCLNTGKP